VIAPSGMAFYDVNEFPRWKDSILMPGAQLLGRLNTVWNTNKVIGEEPLLLEPGAGGFEAACDGQTVLAGLS
jgi:hypothetical protein